MTVAGPWPPVALSRIHGASTEADQEHSRAELIVMLPFPPAAGTSDVLWEIETSHRLPDGPAMLVLPVDPPHFAAASATRTREPTSGELMATCETRMNLKRVCPPQAFSHTPADSTSSAVVVSEPHLDLAVGRRTAPLEQSPTRHMAS